MKTQIIEIRTGSIGLKKKISVIQEDTARQLRCILSDFIIPDGSTARIYAVKPSGNKIYNDGVIEGNTVLVDVTTQLIAEIGEVACQVEITESNGNVLTSFEFVIEVKKRLKDASAIESTNEFTALEAALGKVQNIDTKVSKNTNDISELKTTDNVLSSRIDMLSSLKEGSTTADAELLDIRVKADGSLATSAGNAVREQFDELKGDLVNFSNMKINLCDTSSIVDETYNGLTIKRNKDGSITLNGTAREDVNLRPNAKLKGNNTYFVGSRVDKEASYSFYIDYDGFKSGKVTINNDGIYQLLIQIKSGVTLDNVTFYPIVCYGESLIEYVPFSNLDTSFIEFYQSTIKNIDYMNDKFNKTKSIIIEPSSPIGVTTPNVTIIPKGDYNLVVNIENTKINVISNTGTIKQVNFTPTSYELSHLQYLLWNLDNDSFVKESNLSNVTYNYVVLIYNHYQSVVGQWVLYAYATNIQANKNEIAKIKEPIPSFYFSNSYLTNKLASINEKNRFRNGVTFNFITDMHYPRNTGRSKLLLKRVCDKTSVKNTFFGGDIVYAHLFNEYTDCDIMMHDAGKFIDEYSNYLNNRLYQVKGNHDYTVLESSSSSTGSTLSNESIYEYVMRQVEDEVVGVTCKFYFYVENKMQKTRFIVLDMYEGETNPAIAWGLGHGISNEQYYWLCNEAMNKDGYKYIIFTHASTDSTLGGYDSVLEPVHSIMSAMNNKTTYVNEPLGINIDFTNTTSEVICNIAGHEHRDLYHTKDGVLTILTTCDAWLNDDGVNREPGTITEHAFDVFSIDYTNRTIKTTRIGAGEDREFTY